MTLAIAERISTARAIKDELIPYHEELMDQAHRDIMVLLNIDPDTLPYDFEAAVAALEALGDADTIDTTTEDIMDDEHKTL